MSSLAIGSIVVVCVFGSALLGMLLRTRLPEHHLSGESKDVVKLGMGLIGTMAALVLGLMVGSAKSSFDAQKNVLTQMSAKVILLDRALAHYGADTKEARESLRGVVTRTLARIWPEDRSGSAQLAPVAAGEALYDNILELSPKNDAQRSVQSQALSIAVDIGQTRWLLFQQAGSSISPPFLVVLVSWLSLIFASFGLFAPANATAIVTLLLGALSVSCAIFLILELDRPFDGMLQIPSTPLRNALDQLGK
jgi:UDP-N-acetylmuramyl pentapeptide phosphotransferase/UDP-N-acetylglucosamine-1-phosphate transferase